MGLKLQLNKDGTYRRTWYAVVKVAGVSTCRVLKTPLKGSIPLDENGRFSLDLTGDAAFEASKAKAIEELKSRNSERREQNEASKRNAEALGVQRIKIDHLAEKNAERKKYTIVDTGDAAADKKTNKYNQSVYDILADFAEWASSASKTSKKKYRLITDIDRELVISYYTHISKEFSWQTFRKYVFILKSTFAYFTNGKVENQFAIIYNEEYKGRKSAMSDKSEIAHKPPTDEQMQRVLAFARNIESKPYLHRLTLIAACTGLRIGDCCNLTWDKVDMLQHIVNVKTSKTKTDVAVPIFDYNPEAEDFHPVFGELRRELESALLERGDSPFIVPEAARIYSYNPDRICKEGKALFANALAEEDPAEDAVLVDKTTKHTPADILAAIDAAPFAEQKRQRIRKVYELHTSGKTYTQISAEIGKPKSTISEDLAEVETLTGERIRRGIVPCGAVSQTRMKKLLGNTRAARAQGQRAACLYGFHSLRMYFVVTARKAGLDPEDLKKITGHATVRMVEHYNNADTIEAANIMRKKVGRKQIATKQTNGPTAQSVIGRAGTALPALPSSGTGKSIDERLNELKRLLDGNIIPKDLYDKRCSEILAEI